MLQRFTRLLTGGTSEKSEKAKAPVAEKTARVKEKPVDGVIVNAAGEAVIVDRKAYMKAVRRNLPESLERAYLHAVYLHRLKNGGVLELATFQIIGNLITNLACDKKCAPRHGKTAILPVSRLYLSATFHDRSMEEVDAVIDGLIQEQLLSTTFSLEPTGIPFDTGIAIAVHPVLYK